MSDREEYKPGRAHGAEMHTKGDQCQLVLVRVIARPPQLIWQALTEPLSLSEWAPFDADGSLGMTGATTRLATVGAPASQIAETTVLQADPPRLLVYPWGGQELRWELEEVRDGTRLTMLQTMDPSFVTWAAAGWHLCIDVLELFVKGSPIGRIVGPEAMRFDWQRLTVEYAEMFGVEAPSWPPLSS